MEGTIYYNFPPLFGITVHVKDLFVSHTLQNSYYPLLVKWGKNSAKLGLHWSGKSYKHLSNDLAKSTFPSIYLAINEKSKCGLLHSLLYLFRFGQGRAITLTLFCYNLIVCIDDLCILVVVCNMHMLTNEKLSKIIIHCNCVRWGLLV